MMLPGAAVPAGAAAVTGPSAGGGEIAADRAGLPVCCLGRAGGGEPADNLLVAQDRPGGVAGEEDRYAVAVMPGVAGVVDGVADLACGCLAGEHVPGFPSCG